MTTVNIKENDAVRTILVWPCGWSAGCYGRCYRLYIRAEGLHDHSGAAERRKKLCVMT